MIDWQLCLLYLRKVLGSYGAIEKRTGMDYQHLLRLGLGDVKEPRFNSGIKLLDLAYDVLNDEDFKRIRMR
jgi:hypothetical protein